MNIVLENVSKRFADQEALRGIDLAVETGTRLALVGPNGSGKSTLLRILMGLLSAEGKVLLDDRDPFRNRQAIAHRLAYVPQTAPSSERASATSSGRWPISAGSTSHTSRRKRIASASISSRTGRRPSARSPAA